VRGIFEDCRGFSGAEELDDLLGDYVRMHRAAVSLGRRMIWRMRVCIGSARARSCTRIRRDCAADARAREGADARNIRL